MSHASCLDHHGSHAHDDIVGFFDIEAVDAAVTAAGEFVVFGHHLFGNLRNMVIEIGALGSLCLHIGILVLHNAGLHGIVHVPDCRDTAPGLAKQQFLRGGGAFDLIFRSAQEFTDQFPFRHLQRFDQVGGEKSVLCDSDRGQGQLRDLSSDEIQIGRALGIPGKQLEETRVIDAVKVIVPAMYVEAGLGDGSAADVEYIGQALAGGGVQGFVHEGHTLGGREIGGAQTGHAHAGGYCGSGMFRFGLDENKCAIGNVYMPFGHFFRPVFSHLGRGGDGISAGSVRSFALAHDNGRISIHGHAFAGILESAFIFLAEVHGKIPC